MPIFVYQLTNFLYGKFFLLGGNTLVNTFTIDSKFKKIIDQLAQTQTATKEELLYILNTVDESGRQYLAKVATDMKEKYYKKDVYIRGIVEFSNYCNQNCRYCGIRLDNSKVNRYRLTHQEIIDACARGYDLGYRTFVLQSGEDPYFTDDKLVEIIRALKKNHPDAAITLSLGERSKDSYQKL